MKQLSFALSLLVAIGAVSSLRAAPLDGAVITLWPEGVPGSLGSAEEEVLDDGRYRLVHEPTLSYFAPATDAAAGTAVIVCPGGGYNHLAFHKEGEQYARWLSEQGISAFVLKSRLKHYGHPAPLQDVLRAIRLVRARSDEFGIGSDRIGVIGSSAGGHLAASASTLFDHEHGRTGAALDAVSARPDFAILMYPVITMVEEAAHRGSRINLIGSEADPALMKLVSVEKQVSSRTPPTLLIHTQEDQAVPMENSWLYFRALSEAGVPAELYIFERGGHGMGMGHGLGTTSGWPDRAAEWLAARGLIER